MTVETEITLPVLRSTAPPDEPKPIDELPDWLWPEDKDWTWYLAVGLAGTALVLLADTFIRRRA